MKIETLSAAVLIVVAMSTVATPQELPTSSITGRVLDDEGHPVSDAEVTVRPENSDVDRVVPTDGTGRFSAEGLRPDWYHLVASKAGYIPMELDALERSGAGRPVVVAAGSAVPELVIRVARAGSISGVVVKPDGTPAAHSSVQVLQDRITTDGTKTLAFVARGTVNERGAFRVGDLPPGRYAVSIVPAERGSRDGLSYATTYYSSTLAESDADRIVVAPGQNKTDVNVNLRMTSVTSVRGQVSLADGHAINLRSSDFQLQRNRSDRTVTPVGVPVEAAGDLFTLRDVPAGEYVLSVRSTDAEGDSVVGWLFAGIHGGGVQNITLPLGPPMTVRGRVVFSGAQAPTAPPTRIALIPFGESQAVPASAPLGRDGSFLFPNVMRARFRVIVGPAASVPPWRSKWALESVTGAGSNVPDAGLEVDRDMLEMTVVVSDRLGRVSGVLTADPEVLARATIVAFPLEPALWPSLGRRTIATRPAQNGQFEIRSLPGGDYRIAVLTDAMSNEWLLPEVLRAAIPGSVTVRVSDGTTVVKNIETRRHPGQ